MIEFLATVSHSGESGETSFRDMKVLDAHLKDTPIDELKEDDVIKYKSEFFMEHNQFTVQLKLQDMPRGDKSVPVIGKTYKITIEEVEYESQRVKRNN